MNCTLFKKEMLRFFVVHTWYNGRDLIESSNVLLLSFNLLITLSSYSNWKTKFYKIKKGKWYNCRFEQEVPLKKILPTFQCLRCNNKAHDIEEITPPTNANKSYKQDWHFDHFKLKPLQCYYLLVLLARFSIARRKTKTKPNTW